MFACFRFLSLSVSSSSLVARAAPTAPVLPSSPVWVVARVTSIHVRVRMRLTSSRVRSASRTPAVLRRRLVVHVVHGEAGVEHSGIVLRIHQVMSLLLSGMGGMGMVRVMVVM